MTLFVMLLEFASKHTSTGRIRGGACVPRQDDANRDGGGQ